jgi:hypothetical protein
VPESRLITPEILNNISISEQHYIKVIYTLCTRQIDVYIVRDENSHEHFELIDNQKEVTMSDRDEFGVSLVGFIIGGLTGLWLPFSHRNRVKTRALINEIH